MNLRRSLTVVGCSLMLASGGPAADRQIPPALSARDDVHKIAIKFRNRGYEVKPVSGGVQRGESSVYQISLTRGTDCVIMVGIDGGMAVDLYVRDDVGNTLVQDTRPIARACASFTAAYDGVYDIIITPEAKANLIGTFAVLVGTRQT
jgi:hypothetical protein